jgi:hypothetical protein
MNSTTSQFEESKSKFNFFHPCPPKKKIASTPPP